MCLGIPGKIIEIYEKNNSKFGKVDFSGIKREICLDLTPSAKVGDYVIVHVGFAISILDEEEAVETLKTYREYMDSLKDEVSF